MQREIEIPQSLSHLLSVVGPVWAQDVPGNVRKMVDHFTPLLAQCPKTGVEVTRGLAYGSDERQLLDVFTSDRSSSKPVVVFVHGGAFVDGHRDRSDEIYSNVLYYFARHGCVGINMEYRLAPKHPYPAGTQDVEKAIAWVRDHVSDFGGSPASIYLIGHSAGAAHAASYAYNCHRSSSKASQLRGLVVVSGRVRADNSPENPNARKVEAYYGSDSSLFENISPVSHVTSESVPTMVAFAEFENPLIDIYCLELAYRLSLAKRKAPRMVFARKHNHTSIIAHINTADDQLGREILAFIKDCETESLAE